MGGATQFCAGQNDGGHSLLVQQVHHLQGILLTKYNTYIFTQKTLPSLLINYWHNDLAATMSQEDFQKENDRK